MPDISSSVLATRSSYLTRRASGSEATSYARMSAAPRLHPSTATSNGHPQLRIEDSTTARPSRISNMSFSVGKNLRK
jgi:hypothetical protein